MKNECKECFGTGKHGGYEQSLSECQVCQGSGNVPRGHGADAYDRAQELTDRYAEYHAGLL